MTNALDATLAATLLPTKPSLRLARDAGLAVIGTLVLALSAKIQVPLTPVPMTLQTLVVLALGAAFGARLAAGTVALYLVEGLLGLPVFAGPSYMMGPTGGFLAGFLVAATLIGLLAERGWDRSWLWLTGAMTLGHAAIFALGFAWLAMLIGPEKAFALGVAPFALATIVKTLLGAALVGAGWSAAGRAPGL